MTRSVLTSVARTCPDCGATNTVVAATTEIMPAWRMNCSRCGAAIAVAGGTSLPRVQPAHPPAAGAIRPRRAADRRAAPRRRREGFSRCCTGIHMAAGAALGVVSTALVMSLGSVPPGTTGSAAAPVAITAALRVEAAPMAPVPAPAMPEDAGARYPRPASGPLAGEPLQVAPARAAPPGRSAFDRDPRLADADFTRAPLDPEAAAAAEAALELTRRDRRAVQRRLVFTEHDPRLVDGIFGPATRAAISGWQQTMGLPSTGFLDRQALVLLEWQTEDRYRAWVTAEARARRRQTQTAAAANPEPQTASAGACQRLGTGKIAYGQNVRCDLRGLRENLAQLFRGAERS